MISKPIAYIIKDYYTGTIFTQSGQVIETADVVPGKDHIYHAGKLAAGIYYLKVESSVQSYTSKFEVVK